jgi:predicted secreted protein
VLKLNADGEVVWENAYGGSHHDYGCSIQETLDGGFVIAGFTNSYGVGASDCWILKLDTDGNVIWQKGYGGAYYDEANSIQLTSDSGFIVAGRTQSYGNGEYDCWILKLDANGDVVWQKTYGGSDYDRARFAIEASDGGFIVAGETRSYGSTAYWVLRLDENGNGI